MPDSPHAPSIAKTFRVAILTAPGATPDVFGPYYESEANKNRDDLILSYSPPAIISAVFHATSLAKAEAIAEFYFRG